MGGERVILMPTSVGGSVSPKVLSVNSFVEREINSLHAMRSSSNEKEVLA
jgi:hypothetical protein